MGIKRNKRNRSIKIKADVFYQPKKALGIGTESTGKFTRPETNYQKKRVTIETSSFGSLVIRRKKLRPPSSKDSLVKENCFINKQRLTRML